MADTVDIPLTEDVLRDTLSRIPEGVNIVSIDEVFLYVNKAFADILGYEPKELIGRSVFEFTDEEYRQKVTQETEKRKEDIVSRYEVKMKAKNGRSVMISVSAVPWRDENGKLKGSIGVITDVTKKHAFERALRQSEENYRTVFNSANDAIMIHKPLGEFVAVNQASCKKLGYTEEELLQMRPKDIDTEEFAELVPVRVAEIMDRGHVVFETAHVTKNGQIIPVEISSRIIRYNDEDAVLSIARDITERKALDKLRRSSMKVLHLYSSILQHDIRNDLQLIINQAEVALLQATTEEDVKKPMQSILSTADRMIDLLDVFGKPSEPMDRNVLRVLREVLKDAESTYPQLSISLETRGIEEISSSVAPILFIVLTNTIRNAVTYAGKTPKVLMWLEKAKDSARIIVEDDGPGISQNIRDSIFQKGVSTKGGGYGLYLSRRLIREQGGDLELVSPSTLSGAAFRITLPIDV